MNIIEVTNLVHKYKKSNVFAIKNVSFEVPKNSFFTFLGPNGAGKSTTIEILTTALLKTSGKVTINSFDIDKNINQVRSSIGVLFQEQSLDKQLTAEENIRIQTCVYTTPYKFKYAYNSMSREYKTKLHELCEILALDYSSLFQKTNDLSGGMKRKVEIIKALIHNPSILFLDEPTQGLDPLSRQEVWNYLNVIRKETGLTIFLTTHYLDEAEQADKIVVINHGEIIKDTSPSEWKNELKNLKLKIKGDLPILARELSRFNIKYKLLDSIEIEVNSIHLSSNYLSALPAASITSYSIIEPTLEELYIDLIKES